MVELPHDAQRPVIVFELHPTRSKFGEGTEFGRALDLGCQGVIVPNVDSAEQARAVAGACRYPPAGYRSAGGVLAGQDEPICLVMVESVQAVAELEATLALPGVDGVPLSCPDAERDSPVGSDPPVNIHEYGALPPVAVSVAE